MRHAPYASPDLYPILLDAPGNRVGLVRLDEARYRASSFLDERLLADTGPPIWVPLAEIEQAAASLSASADFIFHIGHVGSTLVSRLLGLSDRVFSLREPAILRTLAHLRSGLGAPDGPWTPHLFGRRLDLFLRLWARVYRPPQRGVIKVTSFVGEMASLLMSRSPASRAVLMFVPPHVYITSILAGPASRAELPSAWLGRRARLRGRLGASSLWDADLSPGEMAAMSWVCESLGLAEAASRHGDRALWLDFEAFLADPAAGLTATLVHLHGEVDPDDVAAMLLSPERGRYSKAPEYAYDADLRRHVLAQGAADHHREIERGLARLNAAGAAHRAIADAARRMAGGPAPR